MDVLRTTITPRFTLYHTQNLPVCQDEIKCVSVKKLLYTITFSDIGSQITITQCIRSPLIRRTIAAARTAPNGECLCGEGLSLPAGIQQQHRHSAYPAGGSGAVSGRVKVKVEPWPGWLSTQIIPPCSSTSRLLIESPRPVPSYWRVKPSST